MCNRTDDGWVEAGVYDAVNASNTWKIKNFKGLLKYVRWEVTAFSGTSATFTLRGMARQWS
jgi:hypothetical protein